MICRVGGATYAGRAVDLGDALVPAVADAIDPATVASAVRTGGRSPADGPTLAVDARAPGPLHDRVGCLTSDPSIRPRTALAVAARSRGWRTPVDERLAATRERLAAARIEDDHPETATYRQTLAEAEADIDRLRERAATARGRMQAGASATERSDGDDSRASPLEDAIRDLSEAETTAAAAREKHRRARDAARSTRDTLQERLRLADEVANLEREARRHLIARARGPYEAALRSVPAVDAGAIETPFDAAPDAMALAIARLGDVVAPVVLACDRFDSAAAAARWLDAPVVRL